jgi:peptide/nickel transport system permease protein
VTIEHQAASEPASPASRARIYWRRLRRQHAALVGTIIFGLFLIVALLGPLSAPFNYAAQNAADRLQVPSLHHLFGTDNFGRDVLSRVLVGTRPVFLLGGAGTLLAAVIGTSLGLLAGYVGRLWDEGIMRVLDVLLAFPALLLAMVLLATAGPSNLNLVIVITILFLPMFARIARSMVLDLRTQEFVEAARLRGETRRHVLFREMLPNTLPPLLVEISIRFSYSIFLVASLGFLGLGVQPPSPDWGIQVNEARTFFDLAPWMLAFPALAIAALVIATSLMADGLRHVLSPVGMAAESDAGVVPEAGIAAGQAQRPLGTPGGPVTGAGAGPCHSRGGGGGGAGPAEPARHRAQWSDEGRTR